MKYLVCLEKIMKYCSRGSSVLIKLEKGYMWASHDENVDPCKIVKEVVILL
jgi:hypothetical protein